MRSWLVHLCVVALMALCAGSALASPQPGWPAGVASASLLDEAATGSAVSAEPSAPAFLPGDPPAPLPAEPSSVPLPLFDPAPLDSAADVPALVDGPRPFPLPELQAAAPRRLIGAPPPLPFLEGLRRPPRCPSVLG